MRYTTTAFRVLDGLAADLRYAVRTLRRSPVFAGGAILTLALGIGANVAVFAFLNGLLLRPLPYPEPDRLVAIEDVLPGYPGEGLPVSSLNFADWQARQHVFAGIGLYDEVNMVLTGTGDPERAFGARASAGVFRALGVSPAIGRTFSDDEDRLGGSPVVVISHGLWLCLGRPADALPACSASPVEFAGARVGGA
jgi:hypothetical protein